MKRFAPPMIAALYDFIWIVEEDVQMEFDRKRNRKNKMETGYEI